MSSTSTVSTQSSISGYADYTLPEHIEFNNWKKTVGAVFDLYGFARFESKRVERAEDLTKKGGLERDIFALSHFRGNEIVENGEKESVLCLPFDRTVPLALFIAKNKTTLSFPFSRQDIDYSWRLEKSAPGRFRSFIQADVDIIDRNLNILAESECINAILEALNKIGVKDYIMYLNHIEISKTLVKTLGLEERNNAEALRIIDKLDKITIEDAVAQLIHLKPKLTEAEVASLVKLFSFKGSVKEFLSAYKELDSVKNFINQVEVLFNILVTKGVSSETMKFSPGMVRGLDYYTGIVFETFLVKAPHRGSIASGGRYDNLVDAVSETSSDSKLQGFGGSIGLTRLFDVCVREGLISPQISTTAKVLICYRKVKENTLQICGATLANRVRHLGIAANLYTNPDSNVKKQLAYANEQGHSNAIIVMEENSFVVKDMINVTEKEVQTLDDAVEVLRNNISIQSANEVLSKYKGTNNPTGNQVKAPIK